MGGSPRISLHVRLTLQGGHLRIHDYPACCTFYLASAKQVAAAEIEQARVIVVEQRPLVAPTAFGIPMRRQKGHPLEVSTEPEE